MSEPVPKAPAETPSDLGAVESPATADRERAAAPPWRTALGWFAGGLIAAPIAILPHEIGHYLVLLAIGVPDLALHYTAVTWDLQEFWEAVVREDGASAAAIAPIWAVALSDAAGPLVTYAIVLACCYGCAVWRPHPALVAVGYLSQLRIRTGASHVIDDLFGIERTANYDELRVAILTGIPAQIFVGFALLVLVVSGIWLARYFPRDRRIVAVVSMVAGMAVSGVAYTDYIGPWLLP